MVCVKVAIDLMISSVAFELFSLVKAVLLLTDGSWTSHWCVTPLVVTSVRILWSGVRHIKHQVYGKPIDDSPSWKAWKSPFTCNSWSHVISVTRQYTCTRSPAGGGGLCIADNTAEMLRTKYLLKSQLSVSTLCLQYLSPVVPEAAHQMWLYSHWSD